MKKRRKTTTSPQYILPGDEGLEVQSMAYAHGLNTLPRLLFEQLPPGAALPDEFFTNMPTDLARIESVARELSATLLSDPQGQFTTNSPSVFRDLYVKGYTDGYRFGLYAVSHGFLQVSYALPDTERRYELAHRFAWERIAHETLPESDPLIEDALEQVRAIFQRYTFLA